MEKPQVSPDEGEGDEAHEVGVEFVVAGGEVAVLLEPVHAPLDDTPLSIRTLVQRRFAVASDLIAALGDHRHDLAVGHPPRHRRVAVALVARELLRPVHAARPLHRFHHRLERLALVALSRRHHRRERHAATVGDQVQLRTPAAARTS